MRALRVGNDVSHAAAVEAIGDIAGSQLRCRRHDDDAELGAGENRLPRLFDVRQHEEQAITAARARRAKRVGDRVAARAEVVERE